MRAAYRIKLSMSRPVSSVPSRYAADGALNRSRTCISSGLYGASTGAASAERATRLSSNAANFVGPERLTRRPRLRRGDTDELMRRSTDASGDSAMRTGTLKLTAISPRSVIPDARIDYRVHEVHTEAHKHEHRPDDDERSLHEHVVALKA